MLTSIKAKKISVLALFVILTMVLSGCIFNRGGDKEKLLEIIESLGNHSDEIEYLDEEYDDFQFHAKGDVTLVQYEAGDETYIEVSIIADDGLSMVYLHVEESRGDLLIYEVHVVLADIESFVNIYYEAYDDNDYYVYENKDIETFVAELAALNYDDMVWVLQSLGFRELDN